MRERLTVITSLVVTAAAAWWAASFPQHVLVGVTPQTQWVPWWYQAAAFPPFVVLCLGLLWAPRRLPLMVLLAGSSFIALIRIAGLIPLSGHATFLMAALLFAAKRRDVFLRRVVMVSSALGLAITIFYKWQWGDLPFFLCSVAVGVCVGAACVRLARAPRPQ